MTQADIGVIGLAVMGENLILNMADNGFSVACFNRTTERVREFVEGRAAGTSVLGCYSLAELVASLQPPRRVLLMVKAGNAVDALIEQLLPLLADGDVIIDGGNANFEDTQRRYSHVQATGKLFIGAGISGGEEGARHGPSIMPGGSESAWASVSRILTSIAARTPDGESCCSWIGNDGSGHFVKMVHNGIEYGDMQLIAESYQLLKQMLGLDNNALHEVFARWNTGVLDSYLIEITAEILGYRDDQGAAVIDLIEDRAGQKGTGRWSVINALNLGQPLTLIAESVFARNLSALKDERVAAASRLRGPQSAAVDNREQFIDDVEQALYASKIVSYAQGFQLLRAASDEYDWQLDHGAIALLWRAGCIIRSVFLNNIQQAFEREPALANLMLDRFFSDALATAQASWRRVAARAVESGIAIPTIGAALAYYDGYRAARSPANMIQAQRDYFGAHTYQRVDRPADQFFHTDWIGSGGATTSQSYNQ